MCSNLQTVWELTASWVIVPSFLDSLLVSLSVNIHNKTKLCHCAIWEKTELKKKGLKVLKILHFCPKSTYMLILRREFIFETWLSFVNSPGFFYTVTNVKEVNL